MTDQTLLQNNDNVSYQSKVPLSLGVIGGMFGSLAAGLAITLIALLVRESMFMAPRMISSVVFRTSPDAGMFPVVLGTITHFVIGAALGGVFAYLMPRIPRSYYIFAGALYGIGVGFVAAAALQVISDYSVNFFVLMVAHGIYGLVLGLVGMGNNLWWDAPEENN